MKKETLAKGKELEASIDKLQLAIDGYEQWISNLESNRTSFPSYEYKGYKLPVDKDRFLLELRYRIIEAQQEIKKLHAELDVLQDGSILTPVSEVEYEER